MDAIPKGASLGAPPPRQLHLCFDLNFDHATIFYAKYSFRASTYVRKPRPC